MVSSEIIKRVVKTTMVPQTTFEEFASKMEGEVDKMKRRIRRLEKQLEETQSKGNHDEALYNGHSLRHLKGLVKCSTSVYGAARTLMTALFSKEELQNNTVSGKTPSKGGLKRPALNLEYIQVIRGILKEQHPDCSNSDMTSKMQAVLKAARLNRLCKYD